ncbi:MAG: porin [Burkholderiales bacterium]
MDRAMTGWRRKWACARVVLGAMGIGAGIAHGNWAHAEDADRLQRLEEKLKEVTEELNALKKPPAAGAGTVEPLEARQALGEALLNKERIEALEQKINQQGIQARFSDGIFLEDPRGNWSLRVGGRVQLDYRKFSPGGAVADTFSLRRVRAGVDATLYKDYRIVVEAEFANGNATGGTAQNVALTNAYFDITTLGPGARIRLGQFKPAFGYEQTLLDLSSDYMERSFGQSLLQNLNYDRGVMVYGAPVAGLWYGLTLANGVGINLEEKQGNAQESGADRPEFTARLTGNLAQFASMQNKTVQAGVSYKSARVANSAANPYSAASVQTEGRGVTFFTPAPFNATGVTADNTGRTILNYEYLFSWGPVKLQGEWFQAIYDGRVTSTAPPVDFKRRLEADYISIMWLVTGESYSDFFRDSLASKIKPRNRFVPGADGGWGAWELGLRYSRFNGKDFANSNAASTGRLSATAPASSSTNEAHAVTFQVKWIANLYTRFWMDVVDTNFKTPIVVNGKSENHERAWMMRAQIDF